MARAKKFSGDWTVVPLPIKATVGIIDDGPPAVGLSAMQLVALNIHNGIVVLESDNGSCEVGVWNAYGSDSLGDGNEIRLTNGAASVLKVNAGDNVRFTKVITDRMPRKVSIA